MSGSSFKLVVSADSDRGLAELSLLDEAGVQLGYREVNFHSLTGSEQRALFDLRTYLHLYKPGREAESVAETGVLIAEKVLGGDLFLKLWQSKSQRTLCIQLPGAGEEENPLAAQLARVPWEIARPAVGEETLAERNVLVRVVHDAKKPVSDPLGPSEDGCLRVLCVFAEARGGSAPLSARRERRELKRLFEAEVYPKRKVEVDFLTHGVTRERLHEQIQGRGGYHVVHWSGHGHLNLLELAKPDGSQDLLSGEGLLNLFTEAGGYIPRLVFLSACHSGDILSVESWTDFLVAARGAEPAVRVVALEEAQGEKKIEVPEQPGYTGTAHALLQGGVPSVVAMRYAVGDDYARSLAIELYRALFAHLKPKKLAEALTQARNELRRSPEAETSFAAADMATPVLYGEEDPGLIWKDGRSPALDTRDRRLHQIPELTVAEHASFVGRTWELAGLGASFIGSAESLEVKPVALVTGLGGMGKTALAAEAIDLWALRFEWVLLYQAKPNSLAFDTTLRDVHMKLYAELGRYHKHVQEHPADAIYRDADATFTGTERTERLTRNLLQALRDEAILLVLDNFESNLKPSPEPGTSPEPLWACQDPAWDRCLTALATGLAGTPSRVLVTCRKRLAALAGEAASGCHRVPLGPLPPGEAALYLREHEALSRMIDGPDEQERRLALRLLTVSRFFPLLMDRLARLAAGGPALRPQLLAALAAIEKRHDASSLPELFSAKPGDAKELAYLEDALAASIDELIRGASPGARRLLWMIAVANEPVALGLVRGVWEGENLEQDQVRQMWRLQYILDFLSPETKAKLQVCPSEIRSTLDALPPKAAPRPDLAPFLAHLVAIGLVTEEHSETDEENSYLACHELVRERIRGWMEKLENERDRAGLDEDAIRLAYADRLKATFRALRHRDMTTALEAGRRALVYCVQARDWDRLRSFAGWVVTSSHDPVLLGGLIPHLQAAAEAAPEGELRRTCLAYLGDAWLQAGRPEAGLPFYEQAAAQARSAAVVGGNDLRQAWADLASISANWVNALVMSGNLDAARQRQIESAKAYREAGSPEIDVLGRELVALHLDVIQGRAYEALPEIESRLERVEEWWRKHRARQPTPEAPDPEFLTRVLIGALDIAMQAHSAGEDWERALSRTDAILEVMRALQRPAEDIGSTRMDRANVLGRLRRFDEAKAELEAGLTIFRNDPARSAAILSSLAELFNEQSDLRSAIETGCRALALREQFPNPGNRANSHGNLASYLDRSGLLADRAESVRHQLAALAYRLITGLGQDLRDSMRSYANVFRRAHTEGTEPAVPRIDELLADPAFQPLEAWLRKRGVDREELQAAVDEFLEEVRQLALGAEAGDGEVPDDPAAGSNSVSPAIPASG